MEYLPDISIIIKKHFALNNNRRFIICIFCKYTPCYDVDFAVFNPSSKMEESIIASSA